MAFNKEEAERQRLLKKEEEAAAARLTLQLAKRYSMIAESLQMPVDLMREKMEDDMPYFIRVHALARHENLSWAQAEAILSERIRIGEDFQRNISKQLNRKGTKPSKNVHPEDMKNARGLYQNKWERPKEKKPKKRGLSFKEKLLARAKAGETRAKARESCEAIERAFNDADQYHPY